jgi:hypothetical protein
VCVFGWEREVILPVVWDPGQRALLCVECTQWCLLACHHRPGAGVTSHNGCKRALLIFFVLPAMAWLALICDVRDS